MPLTSKAALAKDHRQPTAPGFQHRHFAEIARIIAMFADREYQRHVALTFAYELARTNPRFVRARFLRACGLDVHE